jgi:hypothetical protein
VTITKRNLKKELGELYAPPVNGVVRVEVPPLSYLMINGQGDPNTSAEYADAVASLFSVAYAIKFAVKRGPLAVDYGVMPLEGLWWADDMSAFTANAKSQWKWTMIIMQPDLVTRELVEDALTAARGKKDLAARSASATSSLMKASAPRPCTAGRSPRRSPRSTAFTTSSANAAPPGDATTRST